MQVACSILTSKYFMESNFDLPLSCSRAIPHNQQSIHLYLAVLQSFSMHYYFIIKFNLFFGFVMGNM